MVILAKRLCSSDDINVFVEQMGGFRFFRVNFFISIYVAVETGSSHSCTALRCGSVRRNRGSSDGPIIVVATRARSGIVHQPISMRCRLLSVALDSVFLFRSVFSIVFGQ